MGRRNMLDGLGMISQLGLLMAIPIFLCMIVGGFIDVLTNKSPLFLVIFIILGVAAAFRNLYVYTTKQAKRNENKK